MHDAITPLHVRSGYSLLTGTQSAGALVRRASLLGHRRIALTDVNNLCGATVFWKLTADAGLAAIIGAEISASPAGRRNGEWAAVALVAEDIGYENLCRIITAVHRNGNGAHDQAPRTAGGSNEMKPPASAGGQYRPSPLTTSPCSRTGLPPSCDLVARIADLSQGLYLIVDRPAVAEALLAAGMDRRRLYVGIDPASQGRSQALRLAARAEQLGLPTVAAAAALMVEADDREVARLLTAIRLGQTFDTVNRNDLPRPGAYLRGQEELRRQLAEFPQAIENNIRLAEACTAFRLLPRKPVFPLFPCPDGLSPAAYLRHLAEQGARRRYGQVTPAVSRRIDEELALIERMGFCEYFLVVHDIVQYARRRGAPVAGRGSGASSMVAYVLGITNVCPLKYRIPFERFLNARRRDFPDLDVDFCWRLRDEVIDYALRRWGTDHAAMVSMHSTFQQRSALRETAKALGLSDEQVSRLADGGNAGDDVDLPRITRLARRIMLLPHNLSVHPGGIVIGRKPIDCYVPIQPAAKGAGPPNAIHRVGEGPPAASDCGGDPAPVMITQLDKDGVEDLRLVKLDLLGNRNLSTVRYAADCLRRRGVEIDIENLPPADPPTIAELRAADTVGCNQLESPAMRSLLKMMQPADVGDVMKVLALIRPGAASIGMKETFIRRHRGLESPPAGPPAVDAILADTYGVMLYEDDVMLVAAAMMGGSLAEGDQFRKAVQNCHDDRSRLELSRRFLSRCRAAGVDLDYAKAMWVQMAKFNAYSFCRAHAASYAALAYAGAYLKRHWPLEFYVAALNNNQSMYHHRVYVEAAKRAGIVFLPPDANRSGSEFTIERGSVRVGLDRIAGLGPATVQAILDARSRRPFENLSDFLARTHLGREEARSLVLCGAFDWTGRKRPTLMMELNLFRPMARACNRNEAKLLSAGPVIPDPPGDYSPLRKYLDERRILGFSTGRHLMAICRPHLADAVDADSRLLAQRAGKTVRIAGLPEAMRTARTRNSEMMMFLTMEDEFGLFEVTVFPDLARRVRPPGRYVPYIITGRVEEQYGATTLTAAEITERKVCLERLAGQTD